MSSFNREARTGNATLAACKQSGFVEYSADLLPALQYEKAGGEKREKARPMLRSVRQRRRAGIKQSCVSLMVLL